MSSQFLQVPQADGQETSTTRQRIAGVIPIRRHSTESRPSTIFFEPRRPARKSTVTPPSEFISVAIICFI